MSADPAPGAAAPLVYATPTVAAPRAALIDPGLRLLCALSLPPNPNAPNPPSLLGPVASGGATAKAVARGPAKRAARKAKARHKRAKPAASRHRGKPAAGHRGAKRSAARRA